MNDDRKRTWAEIDLSALSHNYRAIRAGLQEGCRFLGVIKADAYGHGALRVAQLLQEEGAEYLAVSCLDEALELRQGGIELPILILGHTPAEYTAVLIENRLTQTATCLAKAVEYSEEAARLGKTLKLHIKLDTGMSRLGYLCEGALFEEGVENIISSCRLPNLEFEGFYTHFAVADEPDEESRRYTEEQFRLFTAVLDEVRARAGITFPIRHCANSGAVVAYPETALDMVRPGLLLYGYGDGGRLGLRPAMRLVTTVSTIKYHEAGTCISYGRRFVTARRSRVGVLAAGYADGLPRLSSNRCSYRVAGASAPQLGTICMDMCMVDLTDIPAAEVGSEVELFGPENSIYQLSYAAQTIPYELLCSVTKRVPRVYVNG
ncbi:MAG: alanine racemase [Oscillospiraceae bacterium]|nr:alanine racemase [Oscillospiraceae bacterium]